MPKRIRLIGVDCAVRAKNVGVAVANYVDGKVTLDAPSERVSKVSAEKTLAEAFTAHLNRWISEADATVVALDAPLGWPQPLAHALAEHRAGDRLGNENGEADEHVFRRTDFVVGHHLGERPLAVGANFIARTAFAALELIAAVRALHPLPLLWLPYDGVGHGVIEVYPKATLLARKLCVRGYKSSRRDEAAPPREALVEAMRKELTIPASLASEMLLSDHALDAVACVLAAKDFLDGNVVAPSADDRPLAEREGWIWFRSAKLHPMPAK